MKNIYLPLLILFALNGFSQEKLKISIDNSFPRVGDVVKLTFETDILKKEIENQLSEDIVITENKNIFGNFDRKLFKSLEFQKSGNYTIGPFSFKLNDKIYKTDSIKIYVAEKLPFKPGIWVRYVEENDEYFLIIEQYLQNTSDYKKKKNTSTYTIGGTTKKEFASIKEFGIKGIVFKNKSSKTSTKTKEDADIFEAGYSYSMTKYKVIFDDEFDGAIKLQKKNFDNFPRKKDLNEIIIKK